MKFLLLSAVIIHLCSGIRLSLLPEGAQKDYSFKAGTPTTPTTATASDTTPQVFTQDYKVQWMYAEKVLNMSTYPPTQTRRAEGALCYEFETPYLTAEKQVWLENTFVPSCLKDNGYLPWLYSQGNKTVRVYKPGYFRDCSMTQDEQIDFTKFMNKGPDSYELYNVADLGPTYGQGCQSIATTACDVGGAQPYAANELYTPEWEKHLAAGANLNLYGLNSELAWQLQPSAFAPGKVFWMFYIWILKKCELSPTQGVDGYTDEAEWNQCFQNWEKVDGKIDIPQGACRWAACECSRLSGTCIKEMTIHDLEMAEGYENADCEPPLMEITEAKKTASSSSRWA